MITVSTADGREKSIDGPYVEGDTFDFECEIPRCGWTSRKWPTKEMAEARAATHAEEHATGVPQPSLLEFERSVGYADRDPASLLIDPDDGWTPEVIGITSVADLGEVLDGDHSN